MISYKRLLSLGVILTSISTTLEASSLRIISTSLASDEILLNLFTPQEARKNIVALSALSSDPRYSNIVEKSSGFKAFKGAPESAFKLKPSHIFFASYNRTDYIDVFEKLKVKTLQLKKFNGLADIFENIRLIGQTINKSENAELIIKKMKASIPVKVSQGSALLFQNDLVALGADTIYSDILKKVGLINIHETRGVTGWPKVSKEYLASLKPTFLIIPLDPTNKNSKKRSLEKIKTTFPWNRFQAVKHNQFLFVNKRQLFSTSPEIMPALYQLRSQLSKYNKKSTQ